MEDEKEEVVMKLKEKACVFCFKDEDCEEKFGPLFHMEENGYRIYAHQYCLFFASGLCQKGQETEGIQGFLHADILQEQRRATRLKCSFCKGKGASIGCCVRKCQQKYHYPCGAEAKSMFLFYDTFLSYCPNHHVKQQIPEADLANTSTVTCSVCLEEVVHEPNFDVLKVPCCHNTWLHRECVQRQALTSGAFFFRCPICNNQNDFQDEMKKMGIHIPERDAAWESENNAFQDLYESHERCDMEPCLCPFGNEHNKLHGKWRIILCYFCGSVACHLECAKLKSCSQDWACTECRKILGDSKGSLFKKTKNSSHAEKGRARSSMKFKGKHGLGSSKQSMKMKAYLQMYSSKHASSSSVGSKGGKKKSSKFKEDRKKSSKNSSNRNSLKDAKKKGKQKINGKKAFKKRKSDEPPVLEKVYDIQPSIVPLKHKPKLVCIASSKSMSKKNLKLPKGSSRCKGHSSSLKVSTLHLSEGKKKKKSLSLSSEISPLQGKKGPESKIKNSSLLKQMERIPGVRYGWKRATSSMNLAATAPPKRKPKSQQCMALLKKKKVSPNGLLVKFPPLVLKTRDVEAHTGMSSNTPSSSKNVKVHPSGTKTHPVGARMTNRISMKCRWVYGPLTSDLKPSSASKCNMLFKMLSKVKSDSMFVCETVSKEIGMNSASTSASVSSCPVENGNIESSLAQVGADSSDEYASVADSENSVILDKVIIGQKTTNNMEAVSSGGNEEKDCSEVKHPNKVEDETQEDNLSLLIINTSGASGGNVQDVINSSAASTESLVADQSHVQSPTRPPKSIFQSQVSNLSSMRMNASVMPAHPPHTVDNTTGLQEVTIIDIVKDGKGNQSLRKTRKNPSSCSNHIDHQIIELQNKGPTHSQTSETNSSAMQERSKQPSDVPCNSEAAWELCGSVKTPERRLRKFLTSAQQGGVHDNSVTTMRKRNFNHTFSKEPDDVTIVGIVKRRPLHDAALDDCQEVPPPSAESQEKGVTTVPDEGMTSLGSTIVTKNIQNATSYVFQEENEKTLSSEENVAQDPQHLELELRRASLRSSEKHMTRCSPVKAVGQIEVDVHSQVSKCTTRYSNSVACQPKIISDVTQVASDVEKQNSDDIIVHSTSKEKSDVAEDVAKEAGELITGMEGCKTCALEEVSVVGVFLGNGKMFNTGSTGIKRRKSLSESDHVFEKKRKVISDKRAVSGESIRKGQGTSGSPQQPVVIYGKKDASPPDSYHIKTKGNTHHVNNIHQPEIRKIPPLMSLTFPHQPLMSLIPKNFHRDRFRKRISRFSMRPIKTSTIRDKQTVSSGHEETHRKEMVAPVTPPRMVKGTDGAPLCSPQYSWPLTAPMRKQKVTDGMELSRTQLHQKGRKIPKKNIEALQDFESERGRKEEEAKDHGESTLTILRTQDKEDSPIECGANKLGSNSNVEEMQEVSLIWESPNLRKRAKNNLVDAISKNPNISNAHKVEKSHVSLDSHGSELKSPSSVNTRSRVQTSIASLSEERKKIRGGKTEVQSHPKPNPRTPFKRNSQTTNQDQRKTVSRAERSPLVINIEGAEKETPHRSSSRLAGKSSSSVSGLETPLKTGGIEESSTGTDSVNRKEPEVSGKQFSKSVTTADAETLKTKFTRAFSTSGSDNETPVRKSKRFSNESSAKNIQQVENQMIDEMVSGEGSQSLLTSQSQTENTQQKEAVSDESHKFGAFNRILLSLAGEISSSPGLIQNTSVSPVVERKTQTSKKSVEASESRDMIVRRSTRCLRGDRSVVFDSPGGSDGLSAEVDVTDKSLLEVETEMGDEQAKTLNEDSANEGELNTSCGDSADENISPFRSSRRKREGSSNCSSLSEVSPQKLQLGTDSSSERVRETKKNDNKLAFQKSILYAKGKGEVTDNSENSSSVNGKYSLRRSKNGRVDSDVGHDDTFQETSTGSENNADMLSESASEANTQPSGDKSRNRQKNLDHHIRGVFTLEKSCGSNENLQKFSKNKNCGGDCVKDVESVDQSVGARDRVRIQENIIQNDEKVNLSRSKSVENNRSPLRKSRRRTTDEDSYSADDVFVAEGNSKMTVFKSNKINSKHENVTGGHKHISDIPHKDVDSDTGEQTVTTKEEEESIETCLRRSRRRTFDQDSFSTDDSSNETEMKTLNGGCSQRYKYLVRSRNAMGRFQPIEIDQTDSASAPFTVSDKVIDSEGYMSNERKTRFGGTETDHTYATVFMPGNIGQKKSGHCENELSSDLNGGDIDALPSGLKIKENHPSKKENKVTSKTEMKDNLEYNRTPFRRSKRQKADLAGDDKNDSTVTGSKLENSNENIQSEHSTAQKQTSNLNDIADGADLHAKDSNNLTSSDKHMQTSARRSKRQKSDADVFSDTPNGKAVPGVDNGNPAAKIVSNNSVGKSLEKAGVIENPSKVNKKLILNGAFRSCKKSSNRISMKHADRQTIPHFYSEIKRRSTSPSQNATAACPTSDSKVIGGKGPGQRPSSRRQLFA